MFIARNRFAVLDKATSTIQIRNLQNEITKKCAPPCATTDAVFYAGTGMLLCRSEDKVGIGLGEVPHPELTRGRLGKAWSSFGDRKVTRVSRLQLWHSLAHPKTRHAGGLLGGHLPHSAARCRHGDVGGCASCTHVMIGTE